MSALSSFPPLGLWFRLFQLLRQPLHRTIARSRRRLLKTRRPRADKDEGGAELFQRLLVAEAVVGVPADLLDFCHDGISCRGVVRGKGFESHSPGGIDNQKVKRQHDPYPNRPLHPCVLRASC